VEIRPFARYDALIPTRARTRPSSRTSFGG
jgi:hypothetical protein